jgi:hypothetical protein
MKEINEVLQQKELDFERVKREIAALQIAALLLADESQLPPKIPAQSADNFSAPKEGTTGSAQEISASGAADLRERRPGLMGWFRVNRK